METVLNNLSVFQKALTFFNFANELVVSLAKAQYDSNGRFGSLRQLKGFSAGFRKAADVNSASPGSIPSDLIDQTAHVTDCLHNILETELVYSKSPSNYDDNPADVTSKGRLALEKVQGFLPTLLDAWCRVVLVEFSSPESSTCREIDSIVAKCCALSLYGNGVPFDIKYRTLRSAYDCMQSLKNPEEEDVAFRVRNLHRHLSRLTVQFQGLELRVRVVGKLKDDIESRVALTRSQRCLTENVRKVGFTDESLTWTCPSLDPIIGDPIQWREWLRSPDYRIIGVIPPSSTPSVEHLMLKLSQHPETISLLKTWSGSSKLFCLSTSLSSHSTIADLLKYLLCEIFRVGQYLIHSATIPMHAPPSGDGLRELISNSLSKLHGRNIALFIDNHGFFDANFHPNDVIGLFPTSENLKVFVTLPSKPEKSAVPNSPTEQNSSDAQDDRGRPSVLTTTILEIGKLQQYHALRLWADHVLRTTPGYMGSYRFLKPWEGFPKMLDDISIRSNGSFAWVYFVCTDVIDWGENNFDPVILREMADCFPPNLEDFLRSRFRPLSQDEQKVFAQFLLTMTVSEDSVSSRTFLRTIMRPYDSPRSSQERDPSRRDSPALNETINHLHNELFKVWSHAGKYIFRIIPPGGVYKPSEQIDKFWFGHECIREEFRLGSIQKILYQFAGDAFDPVECLAKICFFEVQQIEEEEKSETRLERQTECIRQYMKYVGILAEKGATIDLSLIDALVPFASDDATDRESPSAVLSSFMHAAIEYDVMDYFKRELEFPKPYLDRWELACLLRAALGWRNISEDDKASQWPRPNITALRLLLTHGVDPNVGSTDTEPGEAWNAFIGLLLAGNATIETYEPALDAVKLMLCYGADPHAAITSDLLYKCWQSKKARKAEMGVGSVTWVKFRVASVAQSPITAGDALRKVFSEDLESLEGIIKTAERPTPVDPKVLKAIRDAPYKLEPFPMADDGNDEPEREQSESEESDYVYVSHDEVAE